MQVVLSPHVGDLDSVLSVEVFARAIDDLVDFFAVDAGGGRLRPASRTMPRRAMPSSWPPAGACRWCARAASSRPRGRLHGRASAWKARCWGSPGTAPATAATARSGAARRWSARGRASSAPPICGPSPCPAAIAPCASRGARPWACSTKSWVNAAAARRAPPGSAPPSCATPARCWPARSNAPRDQQHGPAVRRRGGAVRAAAGDQLRGASGHGAGVRRRR